VRVAAVPAEQCTYYLGSVLPSGRLLCILSSRATAFAPLVQSAGDAPGAGMVLFIWLRSNTRVDVVPAVRLVGRLNQGSDY
jgi:hypothetical protein